MKKQIIIVGGGFAGLKLARELSDSDYKVMVIDRNNFHQFQPLFYQVATSRLAASNISFPLRKVFNGSRNVTLRITNVLKVVPETNTIITEIGDFQYDYLVFATGADTNYFGNENIRKHAYPMKSTVEAMYIRMRILQNFEDMYKTKDEDTKESLSNYVIVGGGPTGVELAGALMEMKKYVLPKDYQDLDISRMKIYLVEAGPRLLGAMSEFSSKKAEKYLTEMGVNVMLKTQVKDYDGKWVELADGTKIRSRLLIWAAGVAGNYPEGIDKAIKVRGNRIKVDEYHQIEGYENIYAIGDISYMETKKFPHGHPQLANVAIHQAGNLAHNFEKLLHDKKLKPFQYKDKGSMATVGRSKAVVDLPKIKFGGFIAWLTWMLLHLLFIMGMRNRIHVFVNWTAAYFNKNSSLRLIFKPYIRDDK
ncbi:NAD(P)/FAD-dependent oxidoreductase [Flavobacterium sp. NRK F10]|uniref:NADH:ubiquinone reductase (non-electrogenic) n=1 Tax=Flavobacterium sediminis TaxID=2201181 RepID=A0A2U8QRA4_9FLAO|nr:MULTISPECIES: NAD(P)/FAD-dependent oxidoreductase [Flavobacterium]AWM12667.1 FAD-dependent oxidoreductase [Flavobacterium sediminis]MCO6173779.1 NAD(P)/FAD-dependent oxidoreductase [Flavobacterium sp. NRK F10]